MHPDIPATGGIFEGFAIELADADAKSHVSRELSAIAGPDWAVRQFGDRHTDYELIQSKGRLSAQDGWNAAYALRALPGVAYAEPLFALSVFDNPKWVAGRGAATDSRDSAHLPESDSPEWSLDAIRVREAWQKFFPDSAKPPGHGVVIGHPDTGYQDHPELDGRILGEAGYDFLHEDPDAHDDLERPLAEPIPNPGHGTGTASVIVSPGGGRRKYAGNGWVTGVAPGAQIIPLRTSYSVMLTSAGNLARAIEYAATHGAHVISISMGGLFSWRLRRAVMFAQQHGVIICAAAGNYAPFVGWPAAYDDVIACAASNARGGTWRWGCRGQAVDVTAPGESVWRATVRKEEDGLKYDVSRGSGTSLATTCTAGVAAMWLSYHGRDALIVRYGKENLPRVFQRVLRESCVKFPGWKEGKFGEGLVDAFRTLDAPLPDLVADGGTPSDRDADGHPKIDRGGLRTFAHLFDMSDGRSESAVEARDIAERDLRRALAALLDTSQDEVPARLRETGPELAFHLATDPSLYWSFATILEKWEKAARESSTVEDSNAVIAVNFEIEGLRQSLSSRASAPLQSQLTGPRKARVGLPGTSGSAAPHL